jgi:hypothetical protein
MGKNVQGVDQEGKDLITSRNVFTARTEHGCGPLLEMLLA